ncbi:PKD domain-containing protein [Paraferrimonas sedimenticola]|uniref:PKD domain-containing protein n=1 Tax=Paraferrimonas sedimenticola TaxID=375674 RepID=A0AA37W2B2_9GAMM|nr:PKD domain-containing protein [Paraferrimonas sedimenticola]GLP97900.1 hypothetical protein GCM10007895_32070 [Paraferrimonas sedimenticola]
MRALLTSFLLLFLGFATATFSFATNAAPVIERIDVYKDDWGSSNRMVATLSGDIPVSYQWDFGDGTISNNYEAIASHDYELASVVSGRPLQDSYVVTLTVVDANGESATASVEHSVFAFIPVGLEALSYATSALNFEMSVEISPGSTDIWYAEISVANEFSYEFDSGSSFELEHTFSAPGSYLVVVYVQSGNTADYYEQQITVYDTQESDMVFDGWVIKVDEDDGNAEFTDTIDYFIKTGVEPSLLSYSWLAGSFEASTPWASFRYERERVPYRLFVEVTDMYGNTLMQMGRPWLTDFAKAQIVPNSASVRPNFLSVDVTADVTTGSGDFSTVWDFGDGTRVEQEWSYLEYSGTTNTLTANHSYQNSGEYDVSLTVISGTQTDVFQQRVTVVDDVDGPDIQSLTAQMIDDPSEVVGFGSDVIGGAPPLAFVWDFGDGTIRDDFDDGALHEYGEYKQYQVTLTVTDANGKQDSMTINYDHQPFRFAEVGEIEILVNGLDIQANATVIEGTGEYSYYWIIEGAGQFDDQLSVEHSYQQAGTYTAEFWVTSSNHQDIESITFTLASAPRLTLDSFDVQADALSVSANAQASGGQGNIIYSWDFGDGSPTKNGPNQSHDYSTSGSYTVTLTISDSAGSSMSQSETLEVFAALAAQFSAVIDDLKVSLNSQVSGGRPGYNYDWDFGDGNSASGPDPEHEYTSEGTYQVALVVTDSRGEVASDQSSVTVTAPASQPAPTPQPTSAPPPSSDSGGGGAVGLLFSLLLMFEIKRRRAFKRF